MSTDDEEDVFFVNNKGQRRRLPPKVRFDDEKPNLVGLVDPRSSKLICHNCNEVGHISPQYTLKLYQLDDVVRNYVALSPDDRARAP